jgi:hypothetical protein
MARALPLFEKDIRQGDQGRDIGRVLLEDRVQAGFGLVLPAQFRVAGGQEEKRLGDFGLTL